MKGTYTYKVDAFTATVSTGYLPPRLEFVCFLLKSRCRHDCNIAIRCNKLGLIDLQLNWPLLIIGFFSIILFSCFGVRKEAGMGLNLSGLSFFRALCFEGTNQIIENLGHVRKQAGVYLYAPHVVKQLKPLSETLAWRYGSPPIYPSEDRRYR